MSFFPAKLIGLVSLMFNSWKDWVAHIDPICVNATPLLVTCPQLCRHIARLVISEPEMGQITRLCTTFERLP